ncbi:Histone-lysine N-methyltransferase ASHH2, partial [Tetrabaena socialis]
MGKGSRRRSYSDSSASESGSESSGSDERAPAVDRAAPDASPLSSSSLAPEDADNWVACDRCTKWRRIPAGFADQIREDAPWYCEHNPNKAFASCSVPQELTNEEIDAADSEAGESDEDEQEGLKRRRIPAVWQLLKDNVLAHRKRKCQDEDDIMICHCKPVYRGGDGCGPDCINRMLCIECVPGFCPSEEKCTNQMFSKRMYANLEIRRAGAKGFGLFALEDIKAGQFIIEYIGGVPKRRKFSHPQGLDGLEAAAAAASPFHPASSLPGPPPRPPYSLAGPHPHFPPSAAHNGHHHPHSRFSDPDDRDREPPGPPPLPPADLPLPPPPPLHSQHGHMRDPGGGTGGFSETNDLPDRLSFEQLFALQRPLRRAPPPLQGYPRGEREAHGQPTDAVTLFALGLYGSYGGAAVRTVVQLDEEMQEADGGAAGTDAALLCCMSPLVEGGAEAHWSPLLEAPPPPPASTTNNNNTASGAAAAAAQELAHPPPAAAAAGASAIPDGGQLRPVRTQSAAALGALAGAAGPSPYHQQSSPAQYGGWDAGGLGGGGLGAGSASSTPTISGFGPAQQQHGGFAPPAAAAAAAASGPPVVLISSLSDWRLPGGAVAAAAGMGAAAGGVPLPPMAARASPHASPDYQGAVAGAGGAGAGAGADDEENIEEWLRPVSGQHADVWDEPDAFFEAYVKDMVRHRLGKYMQPEHPSRVSVHEATALRAK